MDSVLILDRGVPTLEESVLIQLPIVETLPAVSVVYS